MDITKYDADIQKAINNFIEEARIQEEISQKKEISEKCFLKEKLLSISIQLEEVKNAIAK